MKLSDVPVIRGREGRSGEDAPPASLLQHQLSLHHARSPWTRAGTHLVCTPCITVKITVQEVRQNENIYFRGGTMVWCAAFLDLILSSCSLRIHMHSSTFLPLPKKHREDYCRCLIAPICKRASNPIQCLFQLVPSVPVIGTECTTSLSRINCLLNMKEWMNIYFNDMQTLSTIPYACWDFEDFFSVI